MRAAKRAVLSLLSVIPAAACGGLAYESVGGEVSPPPPSTCVPGSTCSCEGGGVGVQTCSSNGDSYDTCSGCTDQAADASVVPRDGGHDAAQGSDATQDDVAPIGDGAEADLVVVADADPPPPDAGCSYASAVTYNGGFELGNTGFCTGYGYIAPPTLIASETEYTVATDPSKVAVWSDWLSFGDHTSGHGNMLLLNGATTAGVPLWSQTYAVTAFTTYSFSFWGATINLTSYALGTLQVVVNGTPVGTAFTLPETAGQWTPITASWSSGSSTSATVSIIDLDMAAAQNDFAIDDVSFGP